MKRNRSKTWIVWLTLILLVSAVSAYGISAYFTDGDYAKNTFTVGSVEIELTESEWKGAAHNIAAGQVLAKNPVIENVGENDVFVFLTVDIPVKTVETFNEDGSRNLAAATELFQFSAKGDSRINGGWKLIGVYTDQSKEMIDEAELSDELLKGTEGVRYVFAYADSDGLTALPKKDQTPAVFDQIQFCNAMEGQGHSETDYDIAVNAYGIQTRNIVDPSLTGDEQISAVWALIEDTDFEE